MKNYDYVGHLLAVVLFERTNGDQSFKGGDTTFSQEHPRRIRRVMTTVPDQTPAVTLANYESRFPSDS